MSIYRPGKSPFWHYDFIVAGQRYHGSTKCETKAAARAFEAKLRERIMLGDQAKPEITLDEACGLHWEERSRFDADPRNAEGQLAHLVELIGGQTRLSEIDRACIERFVARRRAMPARNKATLVASATVNREVELLGRVMRFIAGKGFAVAGFDWRGLKLREAGERVRELSQDEEDRLFAQLDPDLAPVVEFALLSGQRRTAVITLLWSRVDLAGARASVRLKGGAWHSFPLTPRMVAIIAGRPKVGAHVFTYRCKRSSPRRADRPGRRKGERYPFSRDGWRRSWARALENAGIEDFRFHDLRHTSATRVTRAVGNLKVAQRLLGHTTITTTARYAHAVEDDVRAAMLAAESRKNPEPQTEKRGKSDRFSGVEGVK